MKTCDPHTCAILSLLASVTEQGSLLWKIWHSLTRKLSLDPKNNYNNALY